jgi:hypothetical protein
MPPSTLAEIEREFGSDARDVNGLRLLPAFRTLALLDRCKGAGVRVSVETFRIHPGGGVEPAMRYSDPTPEAVAEHGSHGAVRSLVVDGAVAGYEWNEVWIGGGSTGEGFRIGDGTAA